MASGVRRATGASIGLAITGIAGPGGATPEKPVGTVWIASDIEGEVQTRLLRLWGGRDDVRQRAAQWIMELVRRSLLARA
jgi:nicotinamide-nucleotide amidase